MCTHVCMTFSGHICMCRCLPGEEGLEETQVKLIRVFGRMMMSS